MKPELIEALEQIVKEKESAENFSSKPLRMR